MNRRREAPVFDCAECGTKTRRSRVPAEEFPGTARFGGRGMCNYCYQITPKDKHPTASQLAEKKFENNLSGLTNYLQRRNRSTAFLQKAHSK